MLPLDLHVLGLPLAFILSQDQTLHSKNSILSKPDPIIFSFRFASRRRNQELTNCTTLQIIIKLFSVIQRTETRRFSYLFCQILARRKSGRKGLQRYVNFFNPPKKLFAFFASPLSRGPFFRDCGCKGNDLFYSCKLFPKYFFEDNSKILDNSLIFQRINPVNYFRVLNCNKYPSTDTPAWLRSEKPSSTWI